MMPEENRRIDIATLNLLDKGASRIENVWLALPQYGFGLIDEFFAFIDSLRIDDTEFEPRKLYFEERARESLTCFLEWTQDRPFLKSTNRLYYVSPYLDGLQDQFDHKAWRYTCESGARFPWGPVMQRYSDVMNAQDGQDHLSALRYYESLQSGRVREAEKILSNNSVLASLPEPNDIKNVRQLLDFAFNDSRLTFDRKRSTSSVLSYSCSIPDTDVDFVCTFEGMSRLGMGWPLNAGITYKNIQKPLTIRNYVNNPAWMFPLRFDVDCLFPGCRYYLQDNDERAKLGAMFFATAMSLLADVLCD